MIDYVNREVFDKPEEYYTLAKLRKAAAVDRRLTLREILEKVFDKIPRFKSKDELLEEEFAKFVADHRPDEKVEVEAIPVIKGLLQGIRHQRGGPANRCKPQAHTTCNQCIAYLWMITRVCRISTAFLFLSTSRTTFR